LGGHICVEVNYRNDDHERVYLVATCSQSAKEVRLFYETRPD